MITLKKLIPALEEVGVDRQHIDEAIGALVQLLAELDDVEVKGRKKVDTLLGCMMAVEAIIGDEKNG